MLAAGSPRIVEVRSVAVYLDIQNSIGNGTVEQGMVHSHLTTSGFNG